MAAFTLQASSPWQFTLFIITTELYRKIYDGYKQKPNPGYFCWFTNPNPNVFLLHNVFLKASLTTCFLHLGQINSIQLLNYNTHIFFTTKKLKSQMQLCEWVCVYSSFPHAIPCDIIHSWSWMASMSSYWQISFYTKMDLILEEHSKVNIVIKGILYLSRVSVWVRVFFFSLTQHQIILFKEKSYNYWKVW